jgi:PmbA protein
MNEQHGRDMDYLKLAEDLVHQTSTGGAQAEAVIIHSAQTLIRVHGGEVQELSRADSRGLGLRVFEHGRMGFAYTSDFSDSALEDTRRAALALAESADRDELRTLPVYEDGDLPADDLKIYDEELAHRSVDEKVKLALAVEEAALGHDRRVVSTIHCSYQDDRSRVFLVNSEGFSGGYERTGVVAYLRAVASDADEQAAGIGLGWSVVYGDLDAEKIGVEAARRALQVLGGRPVKTQQASVIMDPFVGTELLSFLAEALTGEAMQRGRSFLMDRMQQRIASDSVNLVDDGRLVGAPASAPFDGEGVPTSSTRLIERGRLEGLLYDNYTANVDGVVSTGNGQRGSYRSLPHPAPTNLYLEPTSTSVEELIGGVERGLYMTSTMNTGGINPANGDYSVGASGLWVEKGEIVKPVAEVTVAGNMLDMLVSVEGVADDLRFIPISASVGAPTIVVGGLTIGGS